jgi:signal transduction histidine kinase
MMIKISTFWERLDLAQKYALTSSLILLAAMLGLGWSTARTIENDVTQSTGNTAALYISSFIEPNLQELAHSESLSAESIAKINTASIYTELGKRVVSIKIWSPTGQVVYSNQSQLIGKIFPPDDSLKAALKGETTSEISELDDRENEIERNMDAPLLEIYTPLHQAGTNKVIGAVELYERADDLVTTIAAAKFTSWRNVALTSLASFLLLYGLVWEGNRTIKRQQSQLELRVSQLTGLLEDNRQLSTRVQEASHQATELNEQFLRRIRTELHDGPAQDIGYALISFETLQKAMLKVGFNGSGAQVLEKVEGALQNALKEIRDLCGGMALPELNDLSLQQAVHRVIRAHESLTDSRVTVNIGELPPDTSLSLKINVYRFIQEALNNAFRHGGGKEQKVEVRYMGSRIDVIVSDQGGGLKAQPKESNGHHIGLVGMRKRVESFGGMFELDGNINGGVQVTGIFPLSLGAPGYG